MKVLNNTADTEESSNCRNKNNCPLDGKCLTPNIIYEAQITPNQLNYKQKVYIGTAETDFKHRFNNHTKSFKLEHYENDTELSKEYWTIKCNHFTPKVTWRIIRKCAPFLIKKVHKTLGIQITYHLLVFPCILIYSVSHLFSLLVTCKLDFAVQPTRCN